MSYTEAMKVTQDRVTQSDQKYYPRVTLATTPTPQNTLVWQETKVPQI